MTSDAWVVYIIRCADKSYYTGITNDLERRLKQHNGEQKGGAKYTSHRRPVALVYTESSPDRSSATRRELQIKALSHEQKKTLVEAPPAG